MIDVSDGLCADASRLAEASRVAVSIDGPKVPLPPGLTEAARAAGEDPLMLAVGGGEDYELLVALPPESLAEATSSVEAAGGSLTAIGSVLEGEGIRLQGPDGELDPPAGFDHLR
jgi:thiamine-monophosphate kinase